MERLLLPGQGPLLSDGRDKRRGRRIDAAKIAASARRGGRARVPERNRRRHGARQADRIVEWRRRERVLLDDASQRLIVVDAIAATEHHLIVFARIPRETNARPPIVLVVCLHASTEWRVNTCIGKAVGQIESTGREKAARGISAHW